MGCNDHLCVYAYKQLLIFHIFNILQVKEPLYPIVCSTAAKTEMTLNNTRSDIGHLQDRCRAEVMKHIKSRQDLLKLKLPSIITDYLSAAFNDNAPLRQVDNYDMLYEF